MGLNSSYIWILIAIGILLFMWLFWGGRKYEFVGLKPLEANSHAANYPDISWTPPDDPNNTPSPNSKETTPSPASPISENPINNGRKPPHINIIERHQIIADDIENKVCRVPTRGQSKGETLCCHILEKIYGKPFARNLRPNFLKNPETGANLELDCYNEELKIACEYNGIQHYKYPNYFHRTEDDFIKQVRRDRYKLDVCDRLGIYLINVPYTVPVNEEAIQKYIISKLPENYRERSSTCERH